MKIQDAKIFGYSTNGAPLQQIETTKEEQSPKIYLISRTQISTIIAFFIVIYINLPHGGGANNPRISSAFKRGTSSINKRSFNNRRDLRFLTYKTQYIASHQLVHANIWKRFGETEIWIAIQAMIFSSIKFHIYNKKIQAATP